MHLSGCCGACSRRSLRCHTGVFIHLERFEGLSCARKSLRRLRRFALGSASKERPYSARPGRLPRCTGLYISLLHNFTYCLLRIIVCLCVALYLRPVRQAIASATGYAWQGNHTEPEASASAHCFWQLGALGKGITLSLRPLRQPIASGNWVRLAREPEAGVSAHCFGNWVHPARDSYTSASGRCGAANSFRKEPSAISSN